jgi:hypothetical protein
MPVNADLGHFLQLRLSKAAVAEIDEAIATTPQLGRSNRCRFIRCAVDYALASITETVTRAPGLGTHEESGQCYPPPSPAPEQNYETDI